MTSNERIKDKIDLYFDDAVAIRTYLHENPELSDQEYETSKYLKEKCKDLGLLIEDVRDSTGFTALLDTGRAGKILGIRTDIDALPIEESEYNLKNKKEVISKNPGVSHACGHDSHMATLLTAARILAELKDDLNGKIYFIFEEGEETGGGIHQMLDHLEDKNLDAVYGNHISPFMDVGEFKVIKGLSHAGCADVDFDVVGKGGHASRPDKCNNPLTATAQILNALTNAWVHRLDVRDTVTFGIGAINGGTTSNVIPDRCNVKGTLRFQNPEAGKEALELFKEVATATAKANRCEIIFNDDTEIVTDPVINDPELTDKVRQSLEDIYPGSRTEAEPGYGAESFYGYSKLCPTVFTRFGAGNDEKGIRAGAHTAEFEIDPEGIKYGIGLQVKFATDFLTGVFDD